MILEKFLSDISPKFLVGGFPVTNQKILYIRISSYVPKISFIIGSLCYSFRIFCFLLPAYYKELESEREQTILLRKPIIEALILFSAIINGLGGGIIWTA